MNRKIIPVQLLTVSFTPDVVVKAQAEDAIEQGLGDVFQRHISVLPDQGVAYEDQILLAEWRNNRWEVAHPGC